MKLMVERKLFPYNQNWNYEVADRQVDHRVSFLMNYEDIYKYEYVVTSTPQSYRGNTDLYKYNIELGAAEGSQSRIGSGDSGTLVYSRISPTTLLLHVF